MKEMLNQKCNEVKIIIFHSVSQYYPLITLLSLCLFASYSFKTAVYHSGPKWFIMSLFPKEGEDNIPGTKIHFPPFHSIS